MDMYLAIMRFSGTSNIDIPLEILFDDEKGIKFESNKSILGYIPLEIKILRTAKLMEEKLMSIITKGTYTMSKALVDLGVMYSNNDITLTISNQFDIYSYKNYLLQGREYETYPPFEDAPQEASFNWGGWLANLVIGAIATVVTSVSDLITGEVSDTNDFMRELFFAAVEGAITGMIGAKILNPKFW